MTYRIPGTGLNTLTKWVLRRYALKIVNIKWATPLPLAHAQSSLTARSVSQWHLWLRLWPLSTACLVAPALAFVCTIFLFHFVCPAFTRCRNQELAHPLSGQAPARPAVEVAPGAACPPSNQVPVWAVRVALIGARRLREARLARLEIVTRLPSIPVAR